MRTAFLDTLVNLMKKNDNLIVLTADMGFSVFENIQKLFPQRFINTGVTEQSTIGVAAGLSLSGYVVFVYAQAIFVTMRCLEQIRLDIAYNNLNVKIIGIGSGFSLNQLGVSHFALEDVGLMRMLPGMTVFTPGDSFEVKWATNKAFDISGPTYIRLAKSESVAVHKKFPKIEIGKGVILKKGKDLSLFACGSLLPMANDIVKILEDKYGIFSSLISMPTIKPIDEELIISQSKRTGRIFTLEEHSIIGGLGSAVSEIIARAGLKTVFYPFGTPDKFTSVTGSGDFLLNQNNLSVDKVILEIIKKIKK